MTATHASSGCQLSKLLFSNEMQNFAVFINTTGFSICPSFYTQQSSSISANEVLICIPTNNTISVNLIVTSTYLWKIQSQLQFPPVTSFVNNIDTSYGLNNVSIVKPITGNYVFCYNDTAQTINIFGNQICIAVPSFNYFFTYCEYNLVQTSTDGFVYMASLKSSFNYFEFAYFLPGVWTPTQSNFVFTNV